MAWIPFLNDEENESFRDLFEEIDISDSEQEYYPCEDDAEEDND